MIYSVLQHKEVPVKVTKEVNYIDYESRDEIMYTVHDGAEDGIHVGYVKLMDTKNGVKVTFIRSQHPNLYRHFGQLADQIEVEHCLKRGIDKPYIQSSAAIGSHICHYKRGKRFINEGVNFYLDNLINKLAKGERGVTRFLGYQKMFMPMNLINEIKEKIKINPVLFK